jgi:hypothetical protein
VRGQRLKTQVCERLEETRAPSGQKHRMAPLHGKVTANPQDEPKAKPQSDSEGRKGKQEPGGTTGEGS